MSLSTQFNLVFTFKRPCGLWMSCPVVLTPQSFVASYDYLRNAQSGKLVKGFPEVQKGFDISLIGRADQNEPRLREEEQLSYHCHSPPELEMFLCLSPQTQPTDEDSSQTIVCRRQPKAVYFLLSRRRKSSKRFFFTKAIFIFCL